MNYQLLFWHGTASLIWAWTWWESFLDVPHRTQPPHDMLSCRSHPFLANQGNSLLFDDKPFNMSGQIGYQFGLAKPLRSTLVCRQDSVPFVRSFFESILYFWSSCCGRETQLLQCFVLCIWLPETLSLWNLQVQYTLISRTVSVLWNAFLLASGSPYWDEFLCQVCTCSPESVPLGQEFPLNSFPLREVLLYEFIDALKRPIMGENSDIVWRDRLHDIYIQLSKALITINKHCNDSF